MSAKVKILAVVLLLTLFPLISYAELKDKTNQVDYLMIYHQDFETEIQDFIAWRSGKGLTVLAVDIDSIYAEFESTGPQEEVREFISYALEYWAKPAPKYVLLVGSVHHVPSYKIESRFADNPNLNEDSVSIDGVFAYNLHEDDTKPDVALGRFPARSPADLRNMIGKTMYFEDDFEEIAYDNDLLFLIDKEDYSIFNNISKTIQNILPSYFRMKQLTNKTDEPGYATKVEMFDAIGRGTVFLSTYVHANSKVWFREGYIVYDDINSYNFSRKPFIFASVATSQSFDNKDNYSMVDKLCATENGGAVATFAPCGLTYLNQSSEIINKFYESVLSDSNSTIGDNILAIQQEQISDEAKDDDLNRRFSLLGDPALKMPLDYIMSLKKKPKITEERIVISPNPVSDKALISIDLKKEDYVTISIFDLQGLPILQEGPFYASGGRFLYNLVPANFSEGMYICRIRIGNEFYYEKIIIAK